MIALELLRVVEIRIGQGTYIVGEAHVSSENIVLSGSSTINADTLMVMPGLIDAHVHVNQPLGEFTTRDKFGDLTKAAVFGGATLVVDFAIPNPGELPYYLALTSQCVS